MLHNVSEALFEALGAEAGDCGFCFRSTVIFELSTSRTSSSEGGEAWLESGLIGMDSSLIVTGLMFIASDFWDPSGVCPG